MPYEQTERHIRDSLCSIFARVDAWFDRDADLRAFRPASGGWSIDQVLEHVALTNRSLLLTLRKHVAIAERRARRGASPPGVESDLSRLEIIGERGSFAWPRPEHLEPTGVASSDDVRATLHAQLGECLILLERMGGGVGTHCRITMSSADLGKIDLYQLAYFLAQHARRHLHQMSAIEAEGMADRTVST
ncbi:DinB family protein [Tundrisphaera sp. TA3]|uniref:DinB family protein n=1 Tax=Tundrisphaera sp. TA3 TaxID=3435775 RepID=UPI003EBCEABD